MGLFAPEEVVRRKGDKRPTHLERLHDRPKRRSIESMNNCSLFGTFVCGVAFGGFCAFNIIMSVANERQCWP